MSSEQLLKNSIWDIIMCNMCINCQRLKAEGNYQILAVFPIYPALSIKLTVLYDSISNILTELKLIYYLSLNTFQLYCSFACCMTFIFMKNHENEIILRVLGVYR